MHTCIDVVGTSGEHEHGYVGIGVIAEAKERMPCIRVARTALFAAEPCVRVRNEGVVRRKRAAVAAHRLVEHT